MAQPHLESPATLSREEMAQIEVGHTAVSRSLARLLVLAFLVASVFAPLAECGLARRPEGGGASATAASVLAAVPREVSARLSETQSTGDHNPWTRLVSANRAVLATLVSFENALEDG